MMDRTSTLSPPEGVTVQRMKHIRHPQKSLLTPLVAAVFQSQAGSRYLPYPRQKLQEGDNRLATVVPSLCRVRTPSALGSEAYDESTSASSLPAPASKQIGPRHGGTTRTRAGLGYRTPAVCDISIDETGGLYHHVNDRPRAFALVMSFGLGKDI